MKSKRVTFPMKGPCGGSLIRLQAQVAYVLNLDIDGPDINRLLKVNSVYFKCTDTGAVSCDNCEYVLCICDCMIGTSTPCIDINSLLSIQPFASYRSPCIQNNVLKSYEEHVSQSKLISFSCQTCKF